MTPAVCACLCEELKLGDSYKSAVFFYITQHSWHRVLYLGERQSPACTDSILSSETGPGELFVPTHSSPVFSVSTGSQNVLPTTSSPTCVVFPFGLSILPHLCISHPLEETTFSVCVHTHVCGVMYMYVCFRTIARKWKSGDEFHLILRQILFRLLLHMSGQLALKLLGHLLFLLPSCCMNAADITDTYHCISHLCANSFTRWAISLASFIKCHLTHMTELRWALKVLLTETTLILCWIFSNQYIRLKTFAQLRPDLQPLGCTWC